MKVKGRRSGAEDDAAKISQTQSKFLERLPTAVAWPRKEWPFHPGKQHQLGSQYEIRKESENATMNADPSKYFNNISKRNNARARILAK